jgi:hypothetical protein
MVLSNALCVSFEIKFELRELSQINKKSTFGLILVELAHNEYVGFGVGPGMTLGSSILLA